MNKPILTMDGIGKRFAGVRALKDAHFDLMRGEIHALMGENGAGKSTLMKILTGIYARDEGSITFEGRPVTFKNPREAQEAGIVIVHQELNMINHLTVAQNVFIGREPMRGKQIDDGKMNRDAQVIFQKLGIRIDPKAVMGSLTVGRQQLCEIAKAISTEASVIVFDEPTAALTDSEIEDLFAILLDLRGRGIGIIYISHRMDEIKRITDRVTVMRDGAFVDTLMTADCTKDDIIRRMVGRVVYEDPKHRSEAPADAPAALSVRHLRAGSMVKDVSFDLRRGEILGLAGLMGAGRTETARAIFGADKLDGGEILVNSRPRRIRSPRDAAAAGIAYLSEDRQRYGLLLEKDIAANITLASLRKFAKGASLDKAEEGKEARRHIERLRIKTPSERQEVRKLSGGNQQKVVIGKWLTHDSRILIFDEPTRGIDVGAKAEIYTLMRELVRQGKSILMISSELTEIMRMSDRVAVMCEGRVTAEIPIEEATQEKIMHAATRREARSAS
ncbi:MAG: sugar ABC transporter ATP-binding protein [Oscillospiraceae bacterium]|jgi:ribose transport system ATP-binding protein|nr:sugar ABC transporter ATP-binding protein [Oscillospiraceae bacterium]